MHVTLFVEGKRNKRKVCGAQFQQHGDKKVYGWQNTFPRISTHQLLEVQNISTNVVLRLKTQHCNEEGVREREKLLNKNDLANSSLLYTWQLGDLEWMANEVKLKNCQFLYFYWLLSTQKHFLLTPPHTEPSSGARCFRSWEKKWSSEASSSSSSRHFKFLWPTSIAWGLAENKHLSPSFHETCPFKSQARKRSPEFTKVPQKEKLGAGIRHIAYLVICTTN